MQCSAHIAVLLGQTGLYHVQRPLLVRPHRLPRAQVQLVQEVFEIFDCPKAAGDVGAPGDILQVFRDEVRVFGRTGLRKRVLWFFRLFRQSFLMMLIT